MNRTEPIIRPVQWVIMRPRDNLWLVTGADGAGKLFRRLFTAQHNARALFDQLMAEIDAGVGP